MPAEDELAWHILGRSKSRFAHDIEENWERIAEAIAGKRILVVGGGGTIGSSTFRQLLRFAPAALHVLDISENYLAELTRQTRAAVPQASSIDLRFWPIDYTNPIAERVFASETRYDAVLNFAALKHVRSEKDVYSLLQMIHTNVIGQWRFKQWFARHGQGGRFFGVSTDKAANPTSLMGATKRLMEDVLFDTSQDAGMAASSARFANVAFSNGSLLQAWLKRLELGQPVAAPRDTSRYFVHPQESGEICLLAATLAAADEIFFPRLDPRTELRPLEDVAAEVLTLCGYRPVRFEEEREAIAAVEKLCKEGAWPLLLTPLDTSGEKPYEEFVGEGEQVRNKGLGSLNALVHRPSGLTEAMLADLADMIARPARDVSKADIVQLIAGLIPNFGHRETGRSLDQRL